MEQFYKIISETGEISIGGGDEIPEGASEITEAEFNELLNSKEDYASTVRSYIEKVDTGKMSLMDVPEGYIEAVKYAVKRERVITNEYGVQDDIYDNILDDYTLSLIESGVL